MGELETTEMQDKNARTQASKFILSRTERWGMKYRASRRFKFIESKTERWSKIIKYLH